MNDFTKRHVLSVDRRDLNTGVNFLEQDTVIIYVAATGKIAATRNRCKHMGGRFTQGAEGVLKCANHGWCLDAAAMKYVNPQGNLAQPQLLVEEQVDGTVQLFELVSPAPWDQDQKPSETLADGEYTVRFYTHACVEIGCGPLRLFTDPWLIGPAFTRGWWLIHEPPSDWLDRLSTADGIYISHSHPDHLSRHTLKVLGQRNPDVPVYVPQFDNDTCETLVKRQGLRNVSALQFGVWTPLGKSARFMLLQDAAGRNDSGILVEYKGHRILNTVDSLNLNGGLLPAPVDLLLSDFAGGASGFPVCWDELKTQQEISQIIDNNLAEKAKSVAATATLTQAKAVAVFAGYFTEAHPADSQIQRLNTKNTPEEVLDLVRCENPEVHTWLPGPGGVFDVGRCSPQPLTSSASAVKPSYEFYGWTEEFREALNYQPLQSLVGIKEYFDWAGFTGNLVLEVIETNEDFSSVLRQFIIDFSDMSLPDKRPSRDHRYLRMRVRSDVFRYVLQQGLPWEEISIGFQARFYREPDVYNFDFWDHFQARLPTHPPVFESGQPV